jgi:TnpA family transposase
VAGDVFYGWRGGINARELWEQMMNTCSCLNLILACIVYWQAYEISRVLSECDPLANRIDLCLLEHVSPIERDNVVLYGQYILDRKPSSASAVAQKGSSLAYKITRISLVPFNRVGFAEALTLGKTVFEWAGGKDAAQDIEKLCLEIERI